MCFTLMACGLTPRCAQDYNDSGVVRFEQIVKMITECDWSIHDVSRVELDAHSKLPRFNMPLELGADLGLRMRGTASQKARRTLILDRTSHQYDKTLSDISGMDVATHAGSEHGVIKSVRDWVQANLKDQRLPGSKAIVGDYAVYNTIAPDLIAALRLDSDDEMPHGDFLHVVEQALPLIEKRVRTN